MSLKRKYGLLASSAAVALLLAACAGDADTDTGTDTGTDNGGTEADGGDVVGVDSGFPETLKNDGEAVEDATLKIALVAESAFPGIFSTEYYEINTDSQVMGPMLGSVLESDENFQWTSGGAAEMEFDKEANIVRLTLQEGVLWHDGEEVTVDDIVFTHEIIGSPDYDGVRYGGDFENIKGMPEFKAGEADSISGLVQVSDYELEIHYEEPLGVNVYQAGGPIWAYAAPRHYYGDLPVDEIASSPQVRQNPIGFGPFKVTNIVPGESVEYEAFEDYFRGAPKISKVTIERIPASGIVEALKQGQFDITYGMPTDTYESFEDGIPGYTTMGTPGQSYDYLGFKLGTWDGTTTTMDPDAKMSDINLRKAMGYAVDIDQIGERFYSGLRYRANSHIIPNFGDYYKDDMEGYPFDPERAKEILADAGYEDTDGDGFVETPEGEELVINYAARASSDSAEPIALYFIEAWKEVGLNVQLLENRLHEVNSFYDRVQADDPDIDVFEAGWGVGSDPNPSGLYGVDAAFNFARFVDDKNTAFFEDMSSEEAFDTDYQIGVFHDWQEYFMNEALPVIPTFWRTELTLVNNRVSAYSLQQGADVDTYGLHAISLLADAPLTE